MSCHVYYNAVCVSIVVIRSGNLLLGIALVFSLSRLPHHLTHIIGFSTVLRHTPDLGPLEVEEAGKSARAFATKREVHT